MGMYQEHQRQEAEQLRLKTMAEEQAKAEAEELQQMQADAKRMEKEQRKAKKEAEKAAKLEAERKKAEEEAAKKAKEAAQAIAIAEQEEPKDSGSDSSDSEVPMMKEPKYPKIAKGALITSLVANVAFLIVMFCQGEFEDPEAGMILLAVVGIIWAVSCLTGCVCMCLTKEVPVPDD